MMSMWKEMWQEQLEYRELLYQMTKRDLLLRYKQTIMGFGWALFMPLVNTAVFSVIFTRVAPIDVGMPYPLFAFTGLIVWNFTASSLKFAVNSLTNNAGLVSKVYFPREVFPVSSVLVGLVDLLVASIALVALMAYYGVGLHRTIVLVPCVLFVQVTFTTAVALLLAMANLFYRDVKYLFEIVVAVWMFITSVLYPASLVGGKLALVMQINPLTPVVDAYRDTLLRGQVPGWSFAYAASLSCVLLLLAWALFHRAEFKFAESI